MDVKGLALDQWRRARNRLLASSRFQDFAVSFPLFRWVSRSRSRQLFDLLAGFAYSQVLFAVVKLDLLGMVQAAPLTADDIARRTGWSADRMTRLLKAACSLDLIEAASGGRYTLGIHGAALLGNPWITKFVAHHHLLYEDLADPVALFRGDTPEARLKTFWGYAADRSADGVDHGNAEAYTALMAASQEAVAREILHAYDFSRHRHLIDVGGSNGTFISAAARRHPQLRFTLFDLPAVADIARQRLERDGLSGRVTIAGGSFLSDPLPEGADIATLIRIAHDHDDDSVLAAMAAIRRILPPDGKLIVAEPLSGIPAIAPVTDAYFGAYFAAMGQGRTRTAAEIARLATSAGFGRARIIRTRMPLVTGLIEINAS
jgi:demethylspheroidene O-methyltransferase